jgi:hypothetical protein
MMGATIVTYRVEGFTKLGGWILLTGAATVESAEVTAAAYTARGWTCRIVEG